MLIKSLKVEVGKVYACGDIYVKVVHEIVDNVEHRYVAVACSSAGKITHPYVGLFNRYGDRSLGSHNKLINSLKEIGIEDAS